MGTHLKQAFKLAGSTVVCASGEGDSFICGYSASINADGVLADDSDFFIYPVNRYFLLDQLTWSETSRPSTMVFDTSARKSFFRVPQEILPLMSCLIGNDYCDDIMSGLKPFHDLIKRKAIEADPQAEGANDRSILVLGIINFIRSLYNGRQPYLSCEDDEFDAAKNPCSDLMELAQQMRWIVQYHPQNPTDVQAWTRQHQDKSLRFAAAVCVHGDDMSEWECGSWCKTKNAARQSAAEVFLASHGARLKERAAENFNRKLPLLAPTIRRILDELCTFMRMSPSRTIKLWSSVSVGILQYVVHDQAADGAKDTRFDDYAHTSLNVNIVPNDETTTSTEFPCVLRIPEKLRSLHKACELRNNSIELLRLGKIKVGRVIDASFLDIDDTVRYPSHLDSLWIRRICYGLLLASLHEKNYSLLLNSETHTISISSSLNGISEAPKIVEHSYDGTNRITSNVAPLFMIGVGVDNESSNVLISTQSLIDAKPTIKFDVFDAATLLCLKSPRSDLYASNTTILDVLVCATIRVLRAAAMAQIRTNTRCTRWTSKRDVDIAFLQYILLQRPGLAAALTNVPENLLPRINVEIMDLAGSLTQCLDSILWLHELCGSPLGSEVPSLARLYDGRLFHLVAALEVAYHPDIDIATLLTSVEMNQYKTLCTLAGIEVKLRNHLDSKSDASPSEAATIAWHVLTHAIHTVSSSLTLSLNGVEIADMKPEISAASRRLLWECTELLTPVPYKTVVVTDSSLRAKELQGSSVHSADILSLPPPSPPPINYQMSALSSTTATSTSSIPESYVSVLMEIAQIEKWTVLYEFGSPIANLNKRLPPDHPCTCKIPELQISETHLGSSKKKAKRKASEAAVKAAAAILALSRTELSSAQSNRTKSKARLKLEELIQGKLRASGSSPTSSNRMAILMAAGCAALILIVWGLRRNRSS